MTPINAPARYDAETLSRFIRATFESAGADTDEATLIADNLVGANLAGHDSHGVVRVPRYLQEQAVGNMHFARDVRTDIDGQSFVLLDGQFGFGQRVGRQATRLGIERAAEHGIALVALRHAGHLGRIGEWAELACEAGITSLHFVNVANSMLVAPFGGAERRFSTAPVTIGIPTTDGAHFLLDFATSRTAEGKALIAQQGGKPLPPDTLVAADGTLGNDPSVLYGEVAPGTVPDPRRGSGALMAMGEHKGSGLAFACELLAGALTGSGTTGTAGTGSGGVYNGMLSIFIDQRVLDDGHDSARAVIDYMNYVRAARPRHTDAPVLAPGDPERLARADRREHGLPLSDETAEQIRQAGVTRGIPAADFPSARH